MLINVLDYGASPALSPSENGKAIQAALDDAGRAGGGKVCIPAGRFVSANLRLPSGVTLYLESGAVLAASRDWRDYTPTGRKNTWASAAGCDIDMPCMTGFIWAEDAEHIGIEGPGTIDGQGQNHEAFPAADDPWHRRPMLVLPIRCKFVRVTDVSLKDPAMFAFYGIHCSRVFLRGITIDSRQSENGDGLDFDGSEDVVISDCILDTGDDAIGLKTTVPGHPCRRYTITNCVLSSIWAGLRVGPESTADMTDITLSNCVFQNCGDAVKIQDCSEGIIENVRVQNCVMRDVPRPLFLTANRYRLSALDRSIRPRLGGLRHVVFSDSTIEQSAPGTDYRRCCMVLSGTTKDCVEDITLRNLRIRFAGGGTAEMAARADVPEYLDYSFIYADIFSINGYLPAAGIFMRHVRGLTVENCLMETAESDARSMLWAEDVRGALLEKVKITGAACALTAAESDFRLSGCDFAVTNLSAGQEALRLSAAADTKETDALFDRLSAASDWAEKGELVETLPVDAWHWEGNSLKTVFKGRQAKMLRLNTFGDVELLVNGITAGRVRLSKLYAGRVKWACELPVLREGENTLELRFADRRQTGGLDSLLPFGEFRPLPAGLQESAYLMK